MKNTSTARQLRIGTWMVALILLAAGVTTAWAEVIGESGPTSFSVCEEAEVEPGQPRDECQAGDLRFELVGSGGQFGFALAAGQLNGDELVDLVVGDPAGNRVYVFFGRADATSAYGLDPAELADRMVSADTQADVILRVPAVPGQPGSFGFSVAVGRERIAGECPPAGSSAALVVGAPGAPGTSSNLPGTVFYLPPGSLCVSPSNPPSPMILDPSEIGQAFQAPAGEADDEFGYSVALGRVLEGTGNGEDVIAGARGALDGAGRVLAFPVVDGTVETGMDTKIEFRGSQGEGVGEALAVGDLDLDFDADERPFGNADDLVIGAVGRDGGKVLLVQGPLSATGGANGDGIYLEETDREIHPIVGEANGDYLGFSIAVADSGALAIGAAFAGNDPPDPEGDGDVRSNVGTSGRIRCGKAYVWNPGVLAQGGPDPNPAAADRVFVARRSADQLGFDVAFGDLNASGKEEFVVSARREDGSGLKIDEIDQGTVYVVFDDTSLSSPVDLDRCAANTDCTGVSGIDVLIFGGDREENAGEEIGFSVATGDFNGDGFDELFLSSVARNRVYAVTLADSDADRDEQGRNLRDDDDDNDGDPDSTDCAPLDASIHAGAEEIACNAVDENCNGLEDDSPDADGDGFDACGDAETPKDCDDSDPRSYPDAEELCDGRDNACAGRVPSEESDLDEDGYVACDGWDDPEGEYPDIVGGGDCNGSDEHTFPGAAPHEGEPDACMQDRDEDDYGDLSPRDGVTPGTDCDDDSATTFPGIAAADDAEACMADDDGDGYGDAAANLPVTAGSDCDDADEHSYPSAPEQCDGNDNACTGEVPADESDPDLDKYVACTGWSDTQADDFRILAGGDCDETDPTTFPGAAANEVDPGACMRDVDGDDFGDLLPPEGVTPGTDCDDGSAVTFPGSAELDGDLNCMKDGDGDGYGDGSTSLPVVPGGDCDDDDATRYDGAEEIPDDDVDQDCNGSDTVTCYEDLDGDGFGSTVSFLVEDGECTGAGESEFDTDCDDADETIFPEAPDAADDGIDQDCNDSDTITCYVDADGDGSGTDEATVVLAGDGSCDSDENESATADDCVDSDPMTYPGAPESCDGNNNACGTEVPEDELDVDGDRFVACANWDDTQGDDAVILGGGDCNEADSKTHPGAATEEPQGAACMQDRDGDGYGDVSPVEGVAPGSDCDDESDVTFPGSAENDAPVNCMRDTDGDGYGDAAATLPVVAGTDCDDADPVTFPGALELCDGLDNACTGATPVDETDQDGDGYVACLPWDARAGADVAIVGGADCDETDPNTHPGAAPMETYSTGCMRDVDGDDFGDIAPPDGVTAGSDCDDASVTAHPGAAELDGPLNCMEDADDDGYGDASAVLPVVAGSDCSDGDPAAHPGVFEGGQGDAVCSDGTDNDCDGTIDEEDSGCQAPVEPCPDVDGDGYAACDAVPGCDATGLTCGDCDDSEATVYPAAEEICDLLDNDCNDEVDEGFDGDGDGYAFCAGDCDDADDRIHPGMAETCNDGIDNDCDAETPDLFDGDGDGATCDADCDDYDPDLNLLDADADGFSTCDGDCDDANDAVHPGLLEVCNDGIDNDCDPQTPDLFDGDGDGATCDTDCDDADPDLNFSDADSDTFSSCAGDCNDADDRIHPLAEEVCDGVDNNCDGNVDENDDDDGDGYSGCFEPFDCDDDDPDVNPGAAEVCDDGTDNDCNPATLDLFDGDGDGSNCVNDCDDTDPWTHPGAAQRCDGNDNTCGGTVPTDETDADGDGFVVCDGWSDTQSDQPGIAGGGDCDGSDPRTFPGVAVNEPFFSACMRDADSDGFGDLTPPAGVTAGTDCDDDSASAASTFPGAAEIDAPLNCMKDVDADGYGDGSVVLPVVAGTDCDDDVALVNPGAVEGPVDDATCSDTLDNDCDGLTDTLDETCVAGGGGGSLPERAVRQMPGRFGLSRK